MTGGFEDGNYLVRVRAQVMTRDDSTGGWVPMGGGGLSNVSVCKRTLSSTQDDSKHEYLIYGQKLSDQTIILSCVIKKDFEYNKVMPTFHHWKTGHKKFGLTFQTAADARAFDKGVRTAVEELLDGIAAQLTELNQIEDVGDDDVFMTLNLPVEKVDSRSSSDASAGKAPPIPPQPSEEGVGTGYSSLHRPGVHEYVYPVIEESKTGVAPSRRDSSGSLKKRGPIVQPTLSISATKCQGGRRKERCRHCQEPYCNETNVKGSCEYAPDCVKSSINAVACISCAQCMLYHCMSDPEGDFVQHPCECGSSDDQCPRRWLGLALLSLIVPCLWCYPPLRACHWCCVSCGVCGGKHTPAS